MLTRRWRRRFSEQPARWLRSRSAVLLAVCLLTPAVRVDGVWSAETAATGAAPAVHGSITVDTAWEGRLAVDGMVTVEAGATLTIRPGTEVRFAAAGGLIVNGVLRAEGAADKAILFLPAAEGPEPWAGIFLGNTPTASVLRSCRITRAGAIEITGGGHRIEACEIAGGAIGISVSGAEARPVITRNRLSDMSEAGIQCSAKSEAMIADNVLERCGRVGIGAQPGTVPQIRGNRISGCETGIEVVQAPPRVSDNTVTGCTRGIALTSSSEGEPVRGNRLEGNETGILCQQSSAPEIAGNTVVKSRDGIVCFRFSRPLLRLNDITDNETGIVCSQFSDATVSANTIARNRRGIYLTYSSYAAIHGNNIEDNGLQIELYFMSLAYERMSQDKPLRGRLQQNKAQVERGMALPLGSKSDGFDPAGRALDLSGNWWGEATTREMTEKGPDADISSIIDGYDVRPEFEYPQEKIAYAPWDKQRISAAGVPAPDAAAPAAPAAAAERSGVDGKVVSDRKPFPGVRVHAFTDAAGAFQGDGFASSAPTTPEGLFSLDLPPGTYFLVAKGPAPPPSPAEPAGEYFGYYGGNPVTVSRGAVGKSIIQVVRRTPPVVTPDARQDMMPLNGVVLGPAGPVEGAGIHLYTDASQQFRGPDMFGPQGAVTGGTDAQGAFTVELPPGTYYLVASKRKSGAMLGHLQLGDLHGYYGGNPIRIVPGTSTSVVIRIDEKVRNTVAPTGPASGRTGILGTIREPSGSVPPGVYAFVTTDPSPMIGAMPSYRSAFLGQDGSYFIEVPEGGIYYVFARSGYGGPPNTGEWNGFYGDAAALPVVVKTGAVVEGIDFVVKKAP